MIISMGHFTAIGMREKVIDTNALVINTCGANDTADRGSMESWVWSNPTNRAIKHVCGTDHSITSVSVECMWQGTKIFIQGGTPDSLTLNGQWRRGKAKRPIGAWNGQLPLIANPGEARRLIYIPAYQALYNHWIQDTQVAVWVDRAVKHPHPVYLRDFDTGRGVNRAGPMSHAWVMAVFLNTGQWPTA